MSSVERDWAIEQKSIPDFEPLSLDGAKSHLRIPLDVTDDDDYVSGLVSASLNYVELEHDVRIVKQDVEITWPQFPRGDTLVLPIWPVQSVNYIRYTDTNGADFEMDPSILWAARLSRKPAQIILKFSQVWPSNVLRTADGVQVGLTVGFIRGTSPELLPIPPVVPTAMKLLIDHWYRNRSAVAMGSLEVPTKLALGVASLMAQVRLY